MILMCRKTATMPVRLWRSSAMDPITGSRSRCRCAISRSSGIPNWLPKVIRKDYAVGFSAVGGGPDPDNNLYLNYGCGGELNYNGYCNPEVDKLIDRQSIEADRERRKKLVWEIERKLAEDGARPIIFYDRRATCWQPYVKGLTIMVNSIANGARIEDDWLDK